MSYIGNYDQDTVCVWVSKSYDFYSVDLRGKKVDFIVDMNYKSSYFILYLLKKWWPVQVKYCWKRMNLEGSNIYQFID